MTNFRAIGIVPILCCQLSHYCLGEEPTGPGGTETVRALFSDPAALVDQDGSEIVTKRAAGHPVPYDWDGDGKVDLLLGCHTSMNTAQAEILFLRNVGTATAPRLKWPGTATAALAGGGKLSTSCGCKSGGAFELHPGDWSGDGKPDLVLNTYWQTYGVSVFLNTGEGKENLCFSKGEGLWRIKSHGMGSGGGDWNNDGIRDYVFPVNAYRWTLYLGRRGPKGQVTFEDRDLTSRDFKIVGHERYPKIGDKSRWFDRTPYAWNFSGKHGADSAITELVAVMYASDYATTRDYSQKKCHINYYWLDRTQKTCTLKGTVAVNSAATTRLSIGDLNADGSMDIVYTGGVFNKDGAGTKIWVMYGKVKNVRRL